MSSSRALLEVDGVVAAWGGRPVLRKVSFAVAPGELLVILGPNGSGKTTLLRCLAGLEPVAAGSVRLRGQELTRVPTHRRGIGLMSQEPALFPNRSVLENIAYGPMLRRTPEPVVRAEVGRLLALLRLEGFEDRRPDQLSGGERQRVALARTLAARPAVVLLDEPFASIDVELRAGLRAEFRRALRELGTAAVHVTHDREEGLFLGDRVGLLFDGELETIGTPADVFRRPRTTRAARLLGYNVLADPSGPIAVLPSDVVVSPLDAGARSGRVAAAGSVGVGSLTIVELDTGERVEVRAEDPMPPVGVGSRVGVRWSRAQPVEERPASAARPPDASKEPKRRKWLGSA